MADFLQGFLGSQQAGVEARNDVTVAIRNWFANRNPLVTRLPYVPVERIDFQMYTHKYRARSTTLGAAIGSATQTSLTVADATFLMNHDVLEIIDSTTGNVERVQITGDPTGPNTVNVTRGIWSQISGTQGMTPLASAASGSTVNLIGNSRNGAEVNQTGLVTIGVPRTQYCQTFQFPVQIGGSAQTARAQVLPGGIQTPFDFNMTVQLQNMVDDIENCLYFGIAQAPNDGSGVTAKMNGLRSIIQTNNISSLTGGTPVNAAAYGSTDLIRDTLQAARAGGGEPDLLVVSTNFMSGFATWGQAIQRVPAGETAFGTPINVLEAPFLHGVTIVEAPLLRPFTAIALTSSEVYIRNKRNPFWQLRGSRGDMVEGDWIAEMAIEVVNESHHAWVEGITAFSAN
ncbi:MAG: SU10 major capsid protein [Isosphaeraceae bacterium]